MNNYVVLLIVKDEVKASIPYRAWTRREAYFECLSTDQYKKISEEVARKGYSVLWDTIDL